METFFINFSNPKPVGSGVFGAGRIVSFAKTVDFSKVIDAVKTGLGLEYVQVAFAGSKGTNSLSIIDLLIYVTMANCLYLLDRV